MDNCSTCEYGKRNIPKDDIWCNVHKKIVMYYAYSTYACHSNINKDALRKTTQNKEV